MRSLALMLFALVIAGAGPASAQGSAEGVPQDDAAARAIRAVIERQLDAFQRDDGAEAFSYASPDIQEKFGTVENFMNMVKTGYEAVYSPADYSFEALLNYRGSPIQVVAFTARDGSVIIARYWMERQADGSWKIDGVDLRAAPGAAV
jgi:hypothetical protein